MKCFGCQRLINRFPEYYKFWSGAYCLDCGEEREVNIYNAEYEAYHENKARKNGWSEEKQIEDAYIRKYGEY